MNALEVFSQGEWSIGSLLVDGEPWFSAKEITTILGLGNPRSSLALLDDDERGVHTMDTPGGPQPTIIVNESGLYSLVLRSRRPEAKAFRKWITGEVLPALRKTGSYGVPREMTRLELIDLARESEVGRLSAEIERDASRAALLAVTPMVEAFQDLMDADGFYSWGAAAQILKWGRNTLTKELRRLKVIQADNRPYQRYARYFFVQATSHRDGHGDTHADFTTRVRPEGLDYLRRRLTTGLTEVG